MKKSIIFSALAAVLVLQAVSFAEAGPRGHKAYLKHSKHHKAHKVHKAHGKIDATYQ